MDVIKRNLPLVYVITMMSLAIGSLIYLLISTEHDIQTKIADKVQTAKTEGAAFLNESQEITVLELFTHIYAGRCVSDSKNAVVANNRGERKLYNWDDEKCPLKGETWQVKLDPEWGNLVYIRKIGE